MEYLAKSSGITLKQHTENVMSEGKKIVDSYPFVIEKYYLITGRDLAKRLEGACKFHDEGKKHPKWQSACVSDYQLFLDWQEKYGGTYKDFEKAVNNTGPNLMKADIRHEIDSVIQFMNKLPPPILAAIGAHHGKLSAYDRYKNKWIDNTNLGKDGKKAWDLFEKLSNDFALSFRKMLKRHYEFAGVRGLLQLADHRASIAENDAFIPDYIPFQYDFKFSDRRPVQKIAEDSWQDDLLLLRAPTGAGKTDAALLWAKKQIENKRADRLIIAMPTRFTSNALAINIAETLSDTGLYHSSSWFKQFHVKAKESKEARHEAKMYHEFARRLQTPVTVATIDHLLMCLSLSREDHHAIAFNLAHSCVVIDEADFYDDFTQANILVLLEALHEYKVPVMIMSASLPQSSLKMYQSVGYQSVEIKEDQSDYLRSRCEVKSISEYEKVDDLSDLLTQAIHQPTIIYANTVDKAVAFYDWFVAKFNIKPIIYHSRFTEPDKLKKEELLIKHLGKDAWKDGTASGIAILTQIGEMSINISADFMISDVCPIDRLIQRAGRLCRFDNKKIGELHVLIPQKNTALYPAPYGSFDKTKRSWVAGYPIIKTIELLEMKRYSAKNFVDFMNIVYEKLADFSVRAKQNAKLLKESFKRNWLILPAAHSEVDDTETMFWKSRDIEKQVSVLKEFPDKSYYYSYMDWESHKNEHAIDLPAYQVRKGLKNFKISEGKVFFKEDEETIYYANPDVYSAEAGLIFRDDDSSDQFP
ncbi:MAG: CRISPR-associated helicase Cas3' [Bacteroidia bacterium]|nr:CRISPR-associated helicase Cas3' [Bacteroidia bacterium]